MKRFLATVLIITLFAGLVPATVSAEADGFEFQVYDESVELIGYTGAEEEVTIPSEYNGLPVTEIGQRVFAGNENIKSVVIPDTITIIGYQAFSRCTKLTSVEFSNNLKKVHAHAFYECPNLKEVNLPKTVLEIDEKAFGYYADMKTGDEFIYSGFKINGYTYTAAEEYATQNEITFVSVGVGPLYVYDVDEDAWEYQQRREARIVKYNGKEKVVSVPSNIDGYEITSIGGNSFAYNENIETVTIPSTVYGVHNSAFQGCSNLQTVNLHTDCEEGSWLSIDDRVFMDCTKLTTVNYNGGLRCSISGNAFDNTAFYNNNFKGDAFYFLGNLLKVKQDVTSFTIKEDTEFISDSAFEGCDKLKEIVIPKNVESVGESAFADCTALTSVVFVPGKYGNIGNGAFLNCTSLKTVVIPENIIPQYQSIGYSYEYVEDLGYWTYVNKTNGLTIYGVKGSEAERYANENGIAFEEYDFSQMELPHSHTFAPATCTEPEKCSCGQTKGVALGHKPVVTKTATEEITTCDLCKVVLNKKAIEKVEKPKGTSFKKVTPAKKSIKITWKKQTKKVSGYKIQYSTSKKFKNAKTVTVSGAKKTKATIKKLKSKKTYYLRIRTYRKVSGKTYLSAWSKAKSVKTK